MTCVDASEIRSVKKRTVNAKVGRIMKKLGGNGKFKIVFNG